MPAKTRKRRIAIPMQAAENMDMKDTCFSVRGTDMTIPMIVTMTEKSTVQSEWSERVLMTFAPVRMWKPIRRMLFASNMQPLNSYAIRLFPKMWYPKSQISLIDGFFIIYLCIVMLVIQKNRPARTMVMSPGTHPNTLRDHD